MIRSQEILDRAKNDIDARRAGDEPLPGCRLVELLGKGGFGEVWKCEVPGGLFKAIKFIHGNLNTLDEDCTQELDALERIKLIRHPFVLSTERIEVQAGEVLILMELADKSLEDVFRECRSAGLAGIPRPRLAAYLLEVAEVLDLMSQKHGLQHLDIKPGNVLLVSNHVKVADFGLVKPIARPDATAPPPRFLQLSPQYAAPENFSGKYSRHSDQYSLAIVYQQMLTGVLPFQGRNARQIMMQQLSAEPMLDSLPVQDRPSVARALAKDAEQRFASCRAFVEALSNGGTPVRSGTPGPLNVAALRNLIDAGKLNQGLPATGLRDVETAREPMPAFKFLESLNYGPLGELWKAQDREGRLRLVYLLGDTGKGKDQIVADRARALSEIRHPLLPALETCRNSAGQVVLVTDCCTHTLRDRFQECRARGAAGIHRPELLDYLAMAADALDSLYAQHQITHLGLNPRTLAFDGDRLMLWEFGFTASIWLATHSDAAALNARNAAPELAHMPGSPAADQYSLALIYAEMLTGIHPRPAPSKSRRGRSSRPQLNLDLAPAADRDVLLRALDEDPTRRYATCSEFVKALNDATACVPAADPAPVQLLPVLPFTSLMGEALPADVDLPTVQRLMTQKQVALMGATEICYTDSFHYTVTPAGVLENTIPVSSLSRMMSFTLEAFRQQWNLQIAKDIDGVLVYRLAFQQDLWQRWFCRAQGLQIQLSVPAVERRAEITEVKVRIEAFGDDPGMRTLRTMGPDLIRSLRKYLQGPERRRHLRWECREPLRVYPVFPDGELGESIGGEGRDFSLGGIGFRLRQRPPTPFCYVHLSGCEALAPWAILVKVVRVEAQDDGWFAIGAQSDARIP